MGPLPEPLLTGVPRIDREHQALMELIDWMEGVCTIANATNCLGCILSVRDTCRSSLDNLLTTLKTYMQGHFRYEERLMVDWSVPHDHIDEHLAAHRLIERRLFDLMDEFARAGNTAAASRQAVGELRAWMEKHLATLDGELAVYIGSESHPT